MHDKRSDNTWRDITQARLTDAMWGVHRNNGVIGTLKDHTRRLENLELWRQEITTLREFARWIALGITVLIGWMLTDPAARVLAKLGAALQ